MAKRFNSDQVDYALGNMSAAMRELLSPVPENQLRTGRVDTEFINLDWVTSAFALCRETGPAAALPSDVLEQIRELEADLLDCIDDFVDVKRWDRFRDRTQAIQAAFQWPEPSTGNSE